jgi:hypothetical protein
MRATSALISTVSPEQVVKEGESRIVPSPPELTALLQQHIAAFGTGRTTWPGGE